MIALSRQQFIRLVRHSYRQLPPGVRRVLRNVDVVVEDLPRGDDLDLVSETDTLFGLYTGVPLIRREGPDPMLPDRITIYRRPILERCATVAEVAEQVRITLWHEVGHYLGMDEGDLHRLGYG